MVTNAFKTGARVDDAPRWQWERRDGDPGTFGQPRRYLLASADPVTLEAGGVLMPGIVAYRDQPDRHGEPTPYDVTVTIGVVDGEVTPTSVAFERRAGGPPLTVTRMQRASVGRFVSDAISFLMGAGLGAAIRRHYANGTISADPFAELDEAEARLGAIDPAELEHVPDGMTAEQFLDSLRADLRTRRHWERIARSSALYVADAPPARSMDPEEKATIVADAYRSVPDGQRREAVRRALERVGLGHSDGSAKKAIAEARELDYLSPAQSTRPR